MSLKNFFNNWIVKNILIAAAVILLLVLAADFILKRVTRHGQEIPVPDFTNMSVGEAERLAALNKMTLDVTDSVFIKRMERGAVYSQNPKAGSFVKSGRRIAVTINAVNPKKVMMPNLVGYSMRQAKAELSSLGLKLGQLIYVSDIATNNVLQQLYKDRDISAGRPIESGSEIDLVVGLNNTDNTTYIPDVLGMKYIGAVDAVHDNSLNIDNTVFDKTVKDYNDTLNAIVYRQVPDISDGPAPMGSKITLYLTTDSRKVPVRKETRETE